MSKQKRIKIENEIIDLLKTIDKIKEIISDMQKANALMEDELQLQEMFAPRSIDPEFDQTYGAELDPQVVAELVALYKSGKKYKYIPGINPLPSKQFEETLKQQALVNRRSRKVLERQFTKHTTAYLNQAAGFAQEQQNIDKPQLTVKQKLSRYGWTPELSQFK